MISLGWNQYRFASVDEHGLMSSLLKKRIHFDSPNFCILRGNLKDIISGVPSWEK